MLIDSLADKIDLKKMDKKTPINAFEVNVEADYNDGDYIYGTVIYTQEEFEQRLPFFQYMEENCDIEDAREYSQKDDELEGLFEKCLDECWPSGAPDGCDYHSYDLEIYYINQRGKYNRVSFK